MASIIEHSKAVLDYSRLGDYAFAAPFTTIAGAAFSGLAALGWSLAILILFSLASFAFGYSVNDYSDADLDRKAGKGRNPISSGRLKKGHAALISLAFLLASLGLLAALPAGLVPIGIASLAIFLTYSIGLRSKARPVIDVVHHAFLFSPYALLGFLAYSPFSVKAVMLFLAFMLVSIVVQLLQEARDYRTDMKQIRTTVGLLGVKRALMLSMALLLGASVIFVGSIAAGFLPLRMALALPLLALIFYPLAQSIADEQRMPEIIGRLHRNSFILSVAALIVYAA